MDMVYFQRLTSHFTVKVIELLLKLSFDFKKEEVG